MLLVVPMEFNADRGKRCRRVTPRLSQVSPATARSLLMQFTANKKHIVRQARSQASRTCGQTRKGTVGHEGFYRITNINSFCIVYN